MSPTDMVGIKAGRLTVLSRVGSDARGQATWLCRCDCGEELVVRGSSLRNGNTRSCGCLLAGAARARRLTHGMANTPAYRSWSAIVERCCNANNPSFPRYGGRGIRVCDRWRASFEAFFADMGPRPSGTSIDRVDNLGHYEPGNCRWATPFEQQNNTSRNKRYTHNGETRTLAEWGRRYGIRAPVVNNRLLRGWSLAEALSTATMPRGGSRRAS